MNLPSNLSELVKLTQYMQSGVVFYTLRYLILQERKMEIKDFVTYSVLVSYFIAIFIGGILNFVVNLFPLTNLVGIESRVLDFFFVFNVNPEVISAEVQPWVLGLVAFLLWSVFNKRTRVNDVCIWRYMKKTHDNKVLKLSVTHGNCIEEYFVLIDENTVIDYTNKILEFKVLSPEDETTSRKTFKMDDIHYYQEVEVEEDEEERGEGDD